MDDKKFQSLTKSQQDVVVRIAAEAERQGVNPKLAIAIAEAESRFNQYKDDKVLTSPAGARGIMQIMPDTARLYNKNLGADIDPDDEDSNIRGGVFILKDLLTKYKSPRIAVAMYNASPKANAEFVRKYETDPDAAIMSLKPETHKYSLRVSQNFNLDDDKETGLIEPVKQPSQFEAFESEASRLLAEQRAREAAEKDKPPPPPTPKSLLERASETAQEIDPETAAIVGAGANLLFPPMTNPELPSKIDTSRARERALEAEDKLELARRNLQSAVPQGAQNLEEAFRESQGELERLKNEQRLAQESLRAANRPPVSVETPAPSSPFPSVDLTRTGRASGPKIEGDSGTRNWIIQEAGQKHQMPEAILDLATEKSRRLIDEDLRNIERIKQVGSGDYGLVTTEGGVQLQLPPTTVAERQAEIDRQKQENQAELERRAEETRIQQEAQARAAEQERLAREAELERLRQERAAVGQRHNVIAGQTRAAAPLQRALTKAETDAEIASRRLARAQEQPGPLARPLETLGVRTAKMGALPRTGVGAGAGVIGLMSYQEALERFKAGDTSEGVLQALQAGSAAAMLVPPAGKGLARVRGAGTAGTLGLGTYQLGRQLLKERPPEQ
jgi:hypothetical protein